MRANRFVRADRYVAWIFRDQSKNDRFVDSFLIARPDVFNQNHFTGTLTNGSLCDYLLFLEKCEKFGKNEMVKNFRLSGSTLELECLEFCFFDERNLFVDWRTFYLTCCLKFD